jgi:site-specific recombinase XerD
MMERESNVNSLTGLTKENIQDFLLNMKESRGWTASTFRNHRQNIATFCNWLIEERLVKTNPVNNISKPKLPKHTPRYIKRDDLRKIEAAILRVKWPSLYIRMRNAAIYHTFLLSGLRLSELLALRIEDFNTDELTILVRQGKGRKDREVPIHPKLLNVLAQFQEHRKTLKHGSPYFFASEYSESAVTTKTIHIAFRRISRVAGVSFTPHKLRHTFAREAINKGLGLYQTKNILGHACISTTQRYLSIANEDLQRSFHGIEMFDL